MRNLLSDNAEPILKRALACHTPDTSVMVPMLFLKQTIPRFVFAFWHRVDIEVDIGRQYSTSLSGHASVPPSHTKFPRQHPSILLQNILNSHKETLVYRSGLQCNTEK